MSWISSSKDSVLGLAVLLIFGMALVVPIVGATLSVVRGETLDHTFGGIALVAVAFVAGTYATAYSSYGLYLKLMSSHRRRNGPVLAARLDTAAVVLAWAALVAGIVGLVPGSAVLIGLTLGAVASIAGGSVRFWVNRKNAGASN
ncbi:MULTISPECIES: hypothetical protein [Nocardiaceae]|uniref:Integral membrane protein n=1 Tax=Rhodococcoides kroppenstedtii TaxID=293050 RepID=A0ABS7NTX3_9NOCA|nr:MULTISPECIES: hypothetical protein [Rhodococcus]MBY6313527.1 hypothetical protein [Rhodococcus kroppenstedtii]MBY6321467.1 hypothetical protein [Rhodococcus kroppenstedtii]MBY6400165.1 hypothetical protein [Rhodococcus kroppenstedtii]